MIKTDTKLENNLKAQSNVRPKQKILWYMVLGFALVHIGAVYGLYLCFTSAQWTTIIMAFVINVVTGFGVTGGAHRLYAHRSYKATWPLRALYAVLQSAVCQGHMLWWSHNHRVHHKYSDTDLDPHNANRGFFYSQIGWLMVEYDPEVKKKFDSVDASDILADPIVRFQKRFYGPMVVIFCFIVPAYIPHILFNETVWNGFFICSMLRLCVQLHSTFSVNSIAHLWGRRPYDKNINAAENMLASFATVGEGYHNYHHVFPWDYSASEFGRINLGTNMIDFFAKFGWAYDRKRATPEMIKQRLEKTKELFVSG